MDVVNRRRGVMWVALLAIWMQVFSVPGAVLHAIAAEIDPLGALAICQSPSGESPSKHAPADQHEHRLCDCCLSGAHQQIAALLAPPAPSAPQVGYAGTLRLLVLPSQAQRAPPYSRPAPRAPPISI